MEIAAKQRPPAPRNSRTVLRRRKRRLRNEIIVVCLTLPIILACAFWLFGFHFYKVTSNSMSPTLLSIEGEWSDKLLCSLVAFKRREPRRWEVVIFHTPTPKNIEAAAAAPLSLEHEMTVKRAVGLPGERLAIRSGDVWTRADAGGVYTRQVKPDKVQRGMWIPLYDEDFTQAGEREFLHFWQQEGNGSLTVAEADGVRHLRPFPEEGGLTFRYQPRVRVGWGGRETALLPGVPDRYLLPQTLLLACPAEGCGGSVSVWHDSGQVQVRCPTCGRFLFEEAIQLYSYNSGLLAVGPNSADDMQNGVSTAMRTSPYRMVADLRLRCTVMFASPQDRLSLVLADNGSEDVLEAAAGRLSLNGKVLSSGDLMPADKWTEIELYRADGALRLFVRNQEVALPPARAVAFPEENEENASSGVSLTVSGGGVRLRRIALDRDIHYASGFGNDYMPQFKTMGKEGEIALSPGMFFPLGDNTELSLDARAWGPVPLALVRGNVIAITQPIERRRLIPVPRD